MNKSLITIIDRIRLEHQLLLKSALLDSGEAILAWNKWKSNIDINNIDFPSFYLLPRVYSNLRGRVKEDRYFNLCKGFYRRAWLANRALFHSVSPALRGITEQNIKILLFKGASLILCYYNDFGMRPMGDFDFLVYPRDRKNVFKILEHLGWEPLLVDSTLKDTLKFRYSIDFIKGGKKIDVHWNSLWCHLKPQDDDDFWKDPVFYDFEGVPTACLNPESALLHTIVHGARLAESFHGSAHFGNSPCLHWITDAVQIISSSKAIDWPKFVMQAEKHIAKLQVRDALTYLRYSWNAPIPTDVIKKISNNPTTIELFHYAHVSAPGASFGFISKLRVMWGKFIFLYLRTYGRKKFNQLTRIQKLIRFLKFLQIIEFQTDHFWKLPFYLIRSILPGKIHNTFNSIQSDISSGPSGM